MPTLPVRRISNWELAAQISSWSPHLRVARRLHLDRYGRLFPHLFMIDVLERVGGCEPVYADKASHERRELEAILALLDRGMESGDRGTREVISTSFMDEATAHPFYARLWPLLGPHLRAERTAPVSNRVADSSAS